MNWQLLVAGGITLALQAGKRFAPQLKSKIPNGYQWITPLVLGMLAAMLVELQLGRSIKEAALRGLAEGFAIGLGAMGLDAGLAESPIKWSNKDDDDDDPPSPLAISMVFALLFLSGCGSSVAREACYAKATAHFHEEAEACDSVACIEALEPEYQRAQEMCP